MRGALVSVGVLLVCLAVHVHATTAPPTTASTLYGLVNPDNVQLVSINLATFKQTNIGPATGHTTDYVYGALAASIDYTNKIIWWMNHLPGNYQSSTLIGQSLLTGLVVKSFPNSFYSTSYIEVDNSTGNILVAGEVANNGCQGLYSVDSATGKMQTILDCLPEMEPWDTSVFDFTHRKFYGSYDNESYDATGPTTMRLVKIDPYTGAYDVRLYWDLSIDLGLQWDPQTGLMWSVSYPALGVGTSGCNNFRSLMTLNTTSGIWNTVAPLPALYGCCNPPAAIPANSPLDRAARTITTINVDYKLYTFDLQGKIIHISTGVCVNNKSCPMWLGYA